MRYTIPAVARRFPLAACLVALGGLAPGLYGAPSIGAVSVTPTTIVAGTPTNILVTAVVTDPSLIAGTVNLQQRDASGRLAAILGTLHDDGSNGDRVAGDKIFSLQVTLNIANPGTIVFQVSAALHASPVRSPSAGVNGVVTGTSSPVTITIVQPSNLSFLNITPTTVAGTVAGNASAVTVNGLTAPVSNGQFSVAVPLREGPNIITAASPAGSTATVTATLDTTPPQLAITEPADGFSTTDTTATVTGIVNDIVVGTVNPTQAAVTVNGIAANVANRTFAISGVPLSLGANTIQAVGRDRVGNATTISTTVNRIALAPRQIRLVSGNNQTGSINQVLAAPLMVQLIGSNNAPAPNTPVVFRVTQDNGLVSAGTPAVSAVVNTDAQGKASVQWTLGARAGAGTNSVEASSAGFAGIAVFSATGNQGAPGNIVVDTGDSQTAAVGQPLPRPLIAVVVDSGNNRLANVPVTFLVTQGGGNIAGQPAAAVTTDSDGRAAASLTLGPGGGIANNQVTATFPGNRGALAVFTASGKVPGSPAATTITGLVLDNSNLPIEGVTIRSVLSNLLTSNSSIVGSLPSVQTNAQGQFTVTSAPVGFVKLLIDGTTATRPGVTFPTLDYDIVTVAGQNATVGLPIYLPALSNHSLCVTATTGGGTLTMPEAPGFSLTFAPGQVTFPGGSKTGCVSATLVHPDKMPMVPGFGQQPRFLVTIQPAGAIFNPPAPIAMPNVDGLAAHAVTEMYSFDHDIGAFVAIGTGTVTGDQLAVASNPGVGVLKAGWHCGGDPATSGSSASLSVGLGPASAQAPVGSRVTLTASGLPPLEGEYVNWEVIDDPADPKDDPTVAFFTSQPGCPDQLTCSAQLQGIKTGIASVRVTFLCDTTGFSVTSSIVKVTFAEVKLTAVGWGGANHTMQKTGSDIWQNDLYGSEGDTPIVNPIWIDSNADGTPEKDDPVAYTRGAKPTLVGVALKISPTVFPIPAKLKVEGFRVVSVSTQPALTFPAVDILLAGDTITVPDLTTDNTLGDVVDNTGYELHWSISYDGGTIYREFAVSTHLVFVTYGEPKGYPGNLGVTAKRIDRETRIAMNQSDPVEIALRTADANHQIVGFNADNFIKDSTGNHWAELDAPNGCDCISLSVLTVKHLQMIGILSAKEGRAFATGGAPPGNTDTSDLEKSTIGGVEVYLAFVAGGLGNEFNNQFEGFFEITDSGIRKGFTVDPLQGPILETADAVSGDKLSYNIIKTTLAAIIRSFPLTSFNGLQFWFRFSDDTILDQTKPIPFPVP